MQDAQITWTQGGNCPLLELGALREVTLFALLQIAVNSGAYDMLRAKNQIIKVQVNGCTAREGEDVVMPLLNYVIRQAHPHGRSPRSSGPAIGPRGLASGDRPQLSTCATTPCPFPDNFSAHTPENVVRNGQRRRAPRRQGPECPALHSRWLNRRRCGNWFVSLSHSCLLPSHGPFANLTCDSHHIPGRVYDPHDV